MMNKIPCYHITPGGCGTKYLRAIIEKHGGTHMGSNWHQHCPDPNYNYYLKREIPQGIKLVYLFSNPCDTLLSLWRGGYANKAGHWIEDRGGDSKGFRNTNINSIEEYVNNGIDYCQLENHFLNFYKQELNFDVLFVKYEHLPEASEAIFDWWGFDNAKHIGEDFNLKWRPRSSNWLEEPEDLVVGFQNMFGDFLELRDSLPPYWKQNR